MLAIPAPAAAHRDCVSRKRTVKYSSAMNPAKKAGSGMGVACKYKRFGLSANIPNAAKPAALDCITRRMAANKNTHATTKQAEDGIAPANPLRHHGSYCTSVSVIRVGSGSQGDPIWA